MLLQNFSGSDARGPCSDDAGLIHPMRPSAAATRDYGSLSRSTEVEAETENDLGLLFLNVLDEVEAEQTTPPHSGTGGSCPSYPATHR